MPKLSTKEVREKILKLRDGNLTKDEMRAEENCIHNILKEHFDGYMLVGFVAGAKNPPIHLCVYDDAKTGLALQNYIRSVEIPILGDDDQEGCDCCA